MVIFVDLFMLLWKKPLNLKNKQKKNSRTFDSCRKLLQCNNLSFSQFGVLTTNFITKIILVKLTFIHQNGRPPASFFPATCCNSSFSTHSRA